MAYESSEPENERRLWKFGTYSSLALLVIFAKTVFVKLRISLLNETEIWSAKTAEASSFRSWCVLSVEAASASPLVKFSFNCLRPTIFLQSQPRVSFVCHLRQSFDSRNWELVSRGLSNCQLKKIVDALHLAACRERKVYRSVVLHFGSSCGWWYFTAVCWGDCRKRPLKSWLKQFVSRTGKRLVTNKQTDVLPHTDL